MKAKKMLKKLKYNYIKKIILFFFIYNIMKIIIYFYFYKKYYKYINNI